MGHPVIEMGTVDMKFYAATIESGTMYVNEIDTAPNEVTVNAIYECVRNSLTMIVDSDLERLEVMAGQMGLAFIPEADQD